ncbi:MAG TPA: helix-turn-helix domain-containing protein [Mobilitalea sp.]|nr:helix-turn-helix domain-containing protein [Mobilitalea sp.]
MNENVNKKIFSGNLNLYLGIHDKTQKEVAKTLGIGLSTFNSWCTAQKMPRMDKIQLLADYFGIVKSDLIENKFSNYEESELNKLLKLCDSRYKSVIKTILDNFYNKNEKTEFLNHFSNILIEYEGILESVNKLHVNQDDSMHD